MARKNLLAGLGGEKLPAGNSGENDPSPAQETSAPHHTARGAIGAISRSIESLKAQAEVELDPGLVDPPPVSDRLDESPAAFAEFLEGIKANKQQVPILVRPHPQHTGRYQVAYGRRRLRAARELQRQVRAIVKPLSDEELVVAQGQENSQRADLSFIERALYASDLERSGVSRDVIMRALGVDKTGLSRLISVAEQVPHEVVRAIGPAPKAGRDRWLEFAVRSATPGATDKIDEHLVSDRWLSMETDERFAALFAAIAPKRTGAVRMKSWKAKDGTKAAKFRADDRGTTIVLDKKAAPEFGEFVIASLDDLYEAYRKSRNS